MENFPASANCTDNIHILLFIAYPVSPSHRCGRRGGETLFPLECEVNATQTHISKTDNRREPGHFIPLVSLRALLLPYLTWRKLGKQLGLVNKQKTLKQTSNYFFHVSNLPLERPYPEMTQYCLLKDEFWKCSSVGGAEKALLCLPAIKQNKSSHPQIVYFKICSNLQTSVSYIACLFSIQSPLLTSKYPLLSTC